MKLKLSDEYDHKALKKYLLWGIGMIFAFKLTAGFAAALIPVFVIGALTQRKPISALFWVVFMTMTSIGNRAIFANGAISVMIIRGTLLLLTFMLASKVCGSRASKPAQAFWGIIPYILWEIAVSAQGYEPVVSYLKITLFLCIFLALFGVANEVNASSRVNAKVLRSAMLAPVIIMIVGSVLVIPIPSLSLMAPTPEVMEAMMRGEITNLYCGLCSHSQAMGPMAGALMTYVFADLVFSIKKWDPIYVLVLICCPIVCFKTSSRTGMGTLIAGLCFVSFLIIQSKGMGARWRGKVLSTMSMIAIGLVVIALAVPQVRDRAVQFALKWGNDHDASEVTVENMFASRQGKIEDAMRGFKENPILGNGFQVSEEMRHQKRSGLLAYLAAPIEKGVFIYAILEEGGVVGFILFMGWLIVLFVSLFKRRAYIMASMFFGFIMVNVGEFGIFSMTYVGGFYWSLTFAAGCLDVQRLKGQGVQVFDVSLEQVFEEIGYDEWVRQRG